METDEHSLLSDGNNVKREKGGLRFSVLFFHAFVRKNE